MDPDQRLKTPRPYNRTNRRMFTREEDELIVDNANGVISQDAVMSRLHCGVETLHRRAEELGLAVRKYIYKSKVTKVPTVQEEAISGSHEQPHVGEDLLLKRLQTHHGDRSYSSTKKREVTQ